jgi:hypothetical protein
MTTNVELVEPLNADVTPGSVDKASQYYSRLKRAPAVVRVTAIALILTLFFAMAITVVIIMITLLATQVVTFSATKSCDGTSKICKLVLSNTRTKENATIYSDIGGTVNNLFLLKKSTNELYNVLESEPTDEAVRDGDWFRGKMLIPWSNKYEKTIP